MGFFVQLGAGAGDLDPRAFNRDGFSEFIKSLPKEKVKKIVLVEPNPINIPKLKECWKDYPQAEIHQIAIIPSDHNDNTAKFYFCSDDGPHYQIGSIDKSHNDNSRYRGQKCNEIVVNVEKINSFLEKKVGTDIQLLAMDIEGMDIPVILDINYDKFKIKYLSFEYLCFNRDKRKDVVFNHLKSKNFDFLGKGVDHNGYDYLFGNKL